VCRMNLRVLRPGWNNWLRKTTTDRFTSYHVSPKALA
jgi:hypothetical protein